jgi:hypothetical protein
MVHLPPYVYCNTWAYCCTPTLFWQQKESTTTTTAPAYLLRVQAIHRRFHHYTPLHDFLLSDQNSMANDVSRLLHLSDLQFLTYFNYHYPQPRRSWQMWTPTPSMLSTMITAFLHRKRSWPESFLLAPMLPIPIGISGLIHFLPQSPYRSPALQHPRSRCPSPRLRSTLSHRSNCPLWSTCTISNSGGCRTEHWPNVLEYGDHRSQTNSSRQDRLPSAATTRCLHQGRPSAKPSQTRPCLRDPTCSLCSACVPRRWQPCNC